MINETLGLWATCRVEKHVPRDTMQLLKLQFKESLEGLQRKIRASQDVRSADEVMQDYIDAFGQACRRDAELNHVDSSDAYLKPERRYL
eukprot:4504523-Prymnesium_polylepis.1